ncbi:WASH complex subunit 1 [Cylas formicarius]|uniref:WASH complex subunit 1 n=1 Tax=Cylas formicarius TaxID=197179 RepID=UPI0029586072|nr:WASH complex subunit 1 [Cylas formicarius]
MSSPYKVPIIPQNLSSEETIIQMAEVLSYVSEITDNVFKTVNHRIKTNNEKLASISKRLDDASEKINSLKGAKKATHVFSSSKYPASDINVDYISIFKETPTCELKRHKVENQSCSSTYEPLNKLQFYHVKQPENRNKLNIDGLGAIPLNINNVNDLILYNSGKNLYKHFVISDSLKVSESIRKTDIQKASELGAAPLSISERSRLAKQSKENYFYNPKIEELPALDVPLDLPDLPGIADDLRYESDIGPGIAPSSVTMALIENIDDLPTVIETEAVQKPTDIPDMLPPPPPPETIPQPPPINLCPPPPIAPPLPTYDIKPDPVPPNQKGSKPASESVSAPQSDLRANLMEAIRQAGGTQKANLRSAKPNSNVTATSKVPTGDLMADLHSKLLMRRKGISGTRKVDPDNSINAESTMAKISAMIPAPLKTESDATSTDEDWN